MKIVLVGLPGSGKTTVGRALSRLIGFERVDADEVIEQQVGMSVAAYFHEFGEPDFRERESVVLVQLLGSPGDSVVSTGGGVVVVEGNRRLLLACARVVYLNSPPATLARRLAGDSSRPLLRGPGLTQKVDALYADRDPLYREVADLAVETSLHRNASSIALSIAKEFCLPIAGAA